MSTYREQRRADRAVEAEQRRADRAAEREQDRADRAAEVERARQAERDRRQAQRQAERDRQAARDQVRQRRQRTRARFATWASTHVVDLLIYPIALVSFALAAPAMSSYGAEMYEHMGWLLPVITELGMWAFAIAVQVTRTRHPERPVWALQVGVWVFGAVAAGLNALRGVSGDGGAVSTGAVMGIVAVAGVVAHQLTVAAPPRSRAERTTARIARQAERKQAAAQRAAVRQATARLDASGRAELVYEPGAYRLRRGRLEPVSDPDAPGPVDAMDDALAELIDAETNRTDTDSGDDQGGGVATLEPPRDTPSIKNRPAQTRARRGRPSRPFSEVRADYLARIETDSSAAQWSAARIARELGCGKKTAAALRDEQRGEGR